MFRPYPKTALLLANPYARQAQQKLPKALLQLQILGLEIIQESVQDPEEFPPLIRRYRDRVDLVIVGGGDGTLNRIVDGLVGMDLPLGILPLGTANDLARTLGIPLSLPEACRTIAVGHRHRIDLGWVNGKYFFNVASLGLSVNITRKLTRDTKRRWGIFAYLITAVKVILTKRPFRAQIGFEGRWRRVKTLQIAIGNGRFYGGGMRIAPDATIDDRRLDLYSLEIQHGWQIFTVLLALWTGHHRQELGSRNLSGTEFEVVTAKPYPINTDGEITAHTPARFRVIPKAIDVIVPRKKESTRKKR